MNTKRIAIATTIARTASAFLLPMASELASRGFEVTFLANTRGDGRAVEEIQAAGFPLLHIGWERTPQSPSNIRACWQLRQFLSKQRVQVLEVHTPVAAALARIVNQTIQPAHRPRTVYFAHGFHFQSSSPKGQAKLWLATERLLRPLTNNLIVINEADRRLASSALGYDEGASLKLPGVGVNLDHFRMQPATAGQLSGAKSSSRIVAVIGALSPGKRPLEAIQAASACATKVKLVFAGDGPLDAEIREEADRLGVEVDLLGRVADVRPLLRTAEALLFLSEREGLPRTVLEAVSMGVPVVAHNIRGVVDILDGVDWWYRPTDRSPVSVAAALEDALVSSHDINQMRQSIRRFGESDVAEQHADHLEMLL